MRNFMAEQPENEKLDMPDSPHKPSENSEPQTPPESGRIVVNSDGKDIVAETPDTPATPNTPDTPDTLEAEILRSLDEADISDAVQDDAATSPATPAPPATPATSDEIMHMLAGEDIEQILASSSKLVELADSLGEDAVIDTLAQTEVIDKDSGQDQKTANTPATPKTSRKTISISTPNAAKTGSRHITVSTKRPQPVPAPISEDELDVLFGSPIEPPDKVITNTEKIAQENEQSAVLENEFDPQDLNISTTAETGNQETDEPSEPEEPVSETVAEVELDDTLEETVQQPAEIVPPKTDLERIIEAEMVANGLSEAAPENIDTDYSGDVEIKTDIPSEIEDSENEYGPTGATVIAMTAAMADELIEGKAKEPADTGKGEMSSADIEAMIDQAQGIEHSDEQDEMDEEAQAAISDGQAPVMSTSDLDALFGRMDGSGISKASSTLTDEQLRQCSEQYGAEAISFNQLDDLFSQGSQSFEYVGDTVRPDIQTEQSENSSINQAEREKLMELSADTEASNEAAEEEQIHGGSLTQEELNQLFARTSETDSPEPQAQSQNSETPPSEEISEIVSQDDLDKLFAQAVGADETPEPSDEAAPVEATAEEDSGGTLSQDDLDKLFAQAGGDDETPEPSKEVAPVEATTEEDSGGSLSQDDLDKLFAQAGGTDETPEPNAETVPAAPVEAAPEEDSGESLSQDDLDKLFAQAGGTDETPEPNAETVPAAPVEAAPEEDSGESLSQDDLDKLFAAPVPQDEDASETQANSQAGATELAPENLDDVISQSIESSDIVSEEQELQQILESQQRKKETAQPDDANTVVPETGVAAAESAALMSKPPATSTEPEPVELPVTNFMDLQTLLDHRESHGIPAEPEPEPAKPAGLNIVNSKVAKQTTQKQEEKSAVEDSDKAIPKSDKLKLRLYRVLTTVNAPFENLPANTREYAGYAAIALVFAGIMLVFMATTR